MNTDPVGTPFTRIEQEAVDRMVAKAILPYRVRFYLLMTALVIVVFIGAFGHYSDQQDINHVVRANHAQVLHVIRHDKHQLAKAIHGVTCSEHALVIHATPLHPRALTKGGKPLHYTAEQKAEILAARRDLLSALPEASCSPSGAS